ncbi:PREDICTED: uncharacterized protein LOC104707344 [Camelina sativa]|uniref:Uncharacterized protein LOC104707344 n=1 Tax=Camelina sativa TaxID=90675 RepID=A0ABM0T7C9_CAMSA|nr:PREDICTED: uncharacterized protein LOC104707344 [Camelina sativa]
MKPHEDWVSESWTVDCVCGVDFDDGKEMVDCDECGVWVHTWCSRYVKGDDLFVCHKCKIMNNDDTELSKLPPVTKSIRMGNNVSSTQTQSETVPILKPCSEIPIEERVHVQGVPGGDLALFECVSSVFSRQLWSCSGYVPKKFSFQYREFPCWDEKEDGKGKDARNWGCRDIEIKHSHQSDVDKEKSLLLRLSTNKRRKDLPGAFEDQANKKAKEEDGDKKTVVL